MCLLQESWILHAQIHPVKKGWHLKNGHFIQLSVLLSKCIKERSYIASTIMMCVWKDDILWKCEEWDKTNKSFGIIKKCSRCFIFNHLYYYPSSLEGYIIFSPYYNSSNYQKGEGVRMCNISYAPPERLRTVLVVWISPTGYHDRHLNKKWFCWELLCRVEHKEFHKFIFCSGDLCFLRSLSFEADQINFTQDACLWSNPLLSSMQHWTQAANIFLSLKT